MASAIGMREHGEVLIPLVAGICVSVDPAAQRIVVDPPEGLIELNRLAERRGRGSRGRG